ncbi:hypothetical protein GCM10010259_66270 [Streptomyces daghestanicus]|uniref:Uncharacterized protein n=1 Tax=Streptomyces daghestanicus TaxID=66885 RepID=A0ABQ3Q7D2_9ACTN|nr:hypothetical protein GCM10010259_66270 [Streptomyces daghestanicus]GHI33188.1 hypothetical protein Sdagh_49180 [Streptomyces daghestanicus]
MLRTTGWTGARTDRTVVRTTAPVVRPERTMLRTAALGVESTARSGLHSVEPTARWADRVDSTRCTTSRWGSGQHPRPTIHGRPCATPLSTSATCDMPTENGQRPGEEKSPSPDAAPAAPAQAVAAGCPA